METETKKYVEKAIEEVLNPTFAVTKQYLAVNEVALENDIPKVERVDLNYADNIVSVYFQIKNQRFFLEIHLTKKPEITVGFAYVESGNRTYLTATSEDLTFAELSGFLTLSPLKGWSKGDYRNNGKVQYKFSRVSFNPFKSEAYELERQLKFLIAELEKDSENVIRLTKNATAYISVCRHQYVSGNAGIHFDSDIISRLAKLNLSIDIDTYIVGTPLMDDDE